MMVPTQTKACLNCKHDHFFAEDLNAWVCNNPNCYCKNFIPSEHSFEAHQKYIQAMEKTNEKVEYMLKNIRQMRNLNNKQFVFAFWHYNNNFSVGMQLDGKTYYYLTDPETIRRCKQKLVEENSDYAPYDENLTIEKYRKELGILAWVLGFD